MAAQALAFRYHRGHMVADEDNDMANSMAENISLQFLHDAELLLVSINPRQKTMRLEFELEDGSLCFVTLHESTELRCEGLSRQNIVYDIRQSRRGELSDEEIFLWEKWVLGFTDSFNETAEEQENFWLDRLRKNEINLVVVDSSTGVKLAAVCESLVVSDRAGRSSDKVVRPAV